MSDLTDPAPAPGNSVALITGAGGAIGAAIARALAPLGFQVVLTDARQSEQMTELARTLSSPLKPRTLDIRSEVQVNRVFAETERHAGPLTALICCAGIMPGSQAGAIDIVDTPLAHWDEVQEVNTRGTFICVREMLRLRNAQPRPHARIVIVSSAAAQLGGYRGDASYVTSKAALLGLTKIAARQAAPLGMTVNCIAPGPVRSAMFENNVAPENTGAIEALVPLGRIGEPADVGAAAAYLCGRGAGWVTGSTVDVNGGYRMQ